MSSTTGGRRPATRTRMIDPQRLALPLLAFALTAAGLFLLIGGDDGAAAPPVGLDTVVAIANVPAGTSGTDLAGLVEVRTIAETARASGALASVDEVGDGVLVAGLVPGQQVLASSFADDVVDALGPDLVAISVRLEAQRWSGPYRLTGEEVTVHQVDGEGTRILAAKVRIIDVASADVVDPRSEQIISLAVPQSTAGAIIAAAAQDALWLVGA